MLGSRQALCTHSHGGLIIFSKGDESVFLFCGCSDGPQTFFCRTNGTDGMCVVNAGSEQQVCTVFLVLLTGKWTDGGIGARTTEHRAQIPFIV